MEISGKDLFDSIGFLIVFLGISIRKLRDWFLLKRKNKKSKVEENSKKLTKIYEKIIECRLDYDACRVSVNQFHNGDYYYSSNSILKMSMTHEATNESTSKIMNDYQNVLVSKYHKFLDDLMKNDIVIYNNIDDMNIGNNDDMISDLKINGTHSFYAVKLKNQNGDVIGFLTMSFCDKPENEINNSQFIEHSKLVSFILRN